MSRQEFLDELNEDINRYFGADDTRLRSMMVRSKEDPKKAYLSVLVDHSFLDGISLL